MAIKKSDLYSSLWESCDLLRGGMDASQYKDYVLVLLFIKYVSDKYAGQRYAPITIPKGASFADMVALKGRPDIGDQINKKIVEPLSAANKLSDMPDFNDSGKLGTGAEMVRRLTDLISVFENPDLDFSKNRADGDDILGDAYEYLNRLREQDIHRIVDVFNRQDESDPRYARMVSVAEIEKNDFNLNLPRYIDSSVAEDIQDLKGHLHGGIPDADVAALDDYWAICPALKNTLFKPKTPGYYDLAVDKAAIKSTILQHPQFAAFIEEMGRHFEQWRVRTAQTLKALEPGFHPKQLIVELADGLLSHYEGKPLIDAYDVYQHLMDYWAETMQDDAYLLASDGWVAKTRHRPCG